MPLQYESDSPLALAVRKVGSQVAFGQLIGKRQSVVNDWLREGSPLPPEFVEVVETATGISRHVLRPDLSKLFANPDIYPSDMPPAPAAQCGAGGIAPAAAMDRDAAGAPVSDQLPGSRPGKALPAAPAAAAGSADLVESPHA